METRFEINIKTLSIKGDDKAMYLCLSDKLLLKVAYSDLETTLKALLTKGQQRHLPAQNPTLIEVEHDKEA